MDFYLDPVRHTGRPQDARREPEELACYDLLDDLSLTYDRVDHDPAYHIETCHQVEAVLGAPIAKNLFLCNRQQTQFYLLLLDGDKVFKTKHLSRQLGCSRLSFAPEDRLPELLGAMPGSASLLGLMHDKNHLVQLVLDRPVLEHPWLGLHPCRNTATLRLATRDVLERLIPALGHEPVVVDLPEDAE
ncbi:MAG: prolyl-tRNA synthetase associated domain-containing protein [Candidatus Faecousia sp.]|nr:prolyl-tRNA synthetase associated domain-containing protein [Clostridiales bacterium]MDY4220211.1 prolyl-tRNA synthetase associated domain-containing protein [Candidatus Faecousia sp.]